MVLEWVKQTQTGVMLGCLNGFGHSVCSNNDFLHLRYTIVLILP